MDLGDILDLIRDILRIGAIGTLLIGCILTRLGLVSNFGIFGVPFAVLGTVSLFIGRSDFHSTDNDARARKSKE